MKQFDNAFTPMNEILEKRGFTLYDGFNPCYIAKMSSCVYVIITSDLETVEIWDCTDNNIDDDRFVKIMTDCEEYEFEELRDNSKVVKRDLAWALGFGEPVNNKTPYCETCVNFEKRSDITGWCYACPGTVIRGMNASGSCKAYKYMVNEEEKS